MPDQPAVRADGEQSDDSRIDSTSRRSPNDAGPFELGDVVEDEISGFRGVVIAIADHLTGCQRIGVRANDTENTARRGDEEFFYPSQLSRVEDADPIEPEHDPVTEVNFEMGQKLRDTVTGFEGVVTTISYELHNCPRAGLSVVDNHDPTENPDRGWFDAPRLEVVGDGISGDFSDLEASEVESETGPSGCDISRISSRP